MKEHGGETLADLIFVGQNLATGGYMLDALWTTTRTVFWAFLIAGVIGFSLGLLVGETKFGERAVMPCRMPTSLNMLKTRK